MMHVSFVLSVYSGDVFRRRDATPLKVESAGVYGGNDVVIPLSKLHQVSGAVLAEGHAVNGGTVSLLYADDGTEVASVDISQEDRQFVFPYVPEGKFVLRVTEAREVNAAASVTSAEARGRRREQTVRSYGQAEQPLLVEGDVEGVLLTAGKAVAQ